ncbi:helix-turn-helix transcriptional regulator [Curtobacterium flaccumfaciens]|uniref:helix-turn-helix transcriptional regulator n=1 Tax=Curtobacterium flaccumfaciens TaxID=2035 RepID=UPI00188AB289|nr:helix-turn-helix transcriptional regulator [Curtobacterium flaccumfaciens]MBF4628931.1 helix-turn-helix transcriptional regulator [Curtobacterium flaccumfaciens]
MRLNVPKMNELRKAHELESNVDLARLLGVDTATLHRVMKGSVAPSSSFIARVKLAFPSVSIDSLFYVDRLGATAGLVPVEPRAAVA